MKVERTQEWWLARVDREGDAEIGAGVSGRDPVERTAAPRVVRSAGQATIGIGRGEAPRARSLTRSANPIGGEPAAQSPGTTSVDDTRIAFGRFVELMRRRKSLTLEQLAERAGLDVGELVSIEDDVRYTPEPRTVYQLARAFNVPQQRLLQLAGLSVGGDAHLRHEAVRFAARSDSVQRLSKEERAALEDFVAVLSRQDG